MASTQRLESKNIVEFYSLNSDPVVNLYGLAKDRYNNEGKYKTTLVLFTDNTRNNHGLTLYNYIVNNPRLGKVWKSDTTYNPNSRNMIDAFIFAPNDLLLQRWYDVETIRINDELEEIKRQRAANPGRYVEVPRHVYSDFLSSYGEYAESGVDLFFVGLFMMLLAGLVISIIF